MRPAKIMKMNKFHNIRPFVSQKSSQFCIFNIEKYVFPMLRRCPCLQQRMSFTTTPPWVSSLVFSVLSPAVFFVLRCLRKRPTCQQISRPKVVPVLVLCIFGICRAFFLAEVFHTRCLLVKFSCAQVFVCFKGYVFYIFTKSYDAMELSGEDDQSNSAGAHPTGGDLHQQEWWNQTPLLDDQMQEPDWWNQTHVPSHQFGEQEREWTKARTC